jgi:preprotein translocase subunit YajC
VKAVANLAPLLLIAALFWLLLIRPAQRRQRQQASTQRAAGVGSEIMLTSGIYGTVTAAEDDTLQLEIAPGTTIKVARGAVARVLDDRDEPAEDALADEQVDDSTPGSDGQ